MRWKHVAFVFILKLRLRWQLTNPSESSLCLDLLHLVSFLTPDSTRRCVHDEQGWLIMTLVHGHFRFCARCS